MSHCHRIAALAFMLVVVWPVLAQAQQATVKVTPDRQSISIDDELRLDVEMEGSFDEVVDPVMNGWELIRRHEPMRTSFRSGARVHQQIRRVYTLAPKRAGKLTIGAVQLRRAGQVVATSQPLSITVRPPKVVKPLPPGQARQLEAKAREPVFLHVQLSRNRFYVGEPFTLTWDIYVDRRVQLASASAEVSKAPNLEGLLAEELAKQNEHKPTKKRIGGRLMNFIPFIRYLVTPIKPGRMVIDRATVVLSTPFTRPNRHKVSSDPLTIRVLPVPKKNRPEWYREGNVGRFQLAATVKDQSGQTPGDMQTGQRLVLDVTVSGTGNLVSLRPPVLDGGEFFETEALPSHDDDAVIKDETGVHGKRSFQFILTPLKPGVHRTPAVRFAYFDPVRERFESLVRPGVSVSVKGAAISQGGREAAFAGYDVGPILERSTLARRHTSFVGSFLFWCLLLGPLLSWLSIEVLHRGRQRDAANPQRRRARGAGANAQKRLRAAEQALKDRLVKDFYGHIARLFTSYFEERVNLPATGMTHAALRSGVEEAGYPAELVDRVVTELEHCDFARFASADSADNEMKETLERTAALLQALDKVRPRRKP